jgi:uncharacterized membrane protein SpoIIM required for sporulation
VKIVRRSWLGRFTRGMQNHPVYYAVWLFILLTGIFCGFSSIQLFGRIDKAPLIEAIIRWLEDYLNGRQNPVALLLTALLSQGSFLLLVILSGSFRLGSTFIFAVPAIKGYGIGSIAGIMYIAFQFGGLCFSFLILLLQNVFLIPCFAYAGSIAWMQIRKRIGRRMSKRYMHDLIPAFIFFAFALIIECSVIPFLISWIGSDYV